MKFSPATPTQKNIFKLFVTLQLVVSLFTPPAFAIFGFGEKRPARQLPTAANGYGVTEADRRSFYGTSPSTTAGSTSARTGSAPIVEANAIASPNAAQDSKMPWDDRLMLDVNDTTYMWLPVQLANESQRANYITSLMTVDENLVPRPLFKDIFETKATDLNMATLADMQQWKVMGFRVLPCVSLKPIKSPAAGQAKTADEKANASAEPPSPYRYVRDCAQYVSIVAQPVIRNYSTGQSMVSDDRVELFYRFSGATEKDFAFENLLRDLQQLKLGLENGFRLTTDGAALNTHVGLDPKSPAYGTFNSHFQTVLKRHVTAARLEYVNTTVNIWADTEVPKMADEDLKSYYSYLPSWTAVYPEKRPHHVEFLTWRMTDQGPVREYHASYFQRGHKVRYVVTESRTCEKKKVASAAPVAAPGAIKQITNATIQAQPKYTKEDCAPAEAIPGPDGRPVNGVMVVSSAKSGDKDKAEQPKKVEPKVYISYEVSVTKEETNNFVERPSYSGGIARQFQESQFLKDTFGVHDATNPDVVYSEIANSRIFEAPVKMPKGITGFSAVLPRTSNSYRLWGVYAGHVEATATTALYAAAAADYINNMFINPYADGPGRNCSHPEAIRRVSFCYSMQNLNCEKICEDFSTVKERLAQQQATAAPPQSSGTTGQGAAPQTPPPPMNTDIVIRRPPQNPGQVTNSRYFKCEPRNGSVTALYGYLNLEDNGYVNSVEFSARVREGMGFTRRYDVRVNKSDIRANSNFAPGASNMQSVTFNQPGSKILGRVERQPGVKEYRLEGPKRQSDVFANTDVAAQGAGAIKKNTGARRTGSWSYRVIFDYNGQKIDLSSKSQGLNCKFDDEVF